MKSSYPRSCYYAWAATILAAIILWASLRGFYGNIPKSLAEEYAAENLALCIAFAVTSLFAIWLAIALWRSSSRENVLSSYAQPTSSRLRAVACELFRAMSLAALYPFVFMLAETSSSYLLSWILWIHNGSDRPEGLLSKLLLLCVVTYSLRASFRRVAGRPPLFSSLNEQMPIISRPSRVYPTLSILVALWGVLSAIVFNTIGMIDGELDPYLSLSRFLRFGTIMFAVFTIGITITLWRFAPPSAILRPIGKFRALDYNLYRLASFVGLYAYGTILAMLIAILGVKSFSARYGTTQDDFLQFFSFDLRMLPVLFFGVIMLVVGFVSSLMPFVQRVDTPIPTSPDPHAEAIPTTPLA